jgi:hypothetical protein
MKTSIYKFYFFPSLFLLLLVCGSVSAQQPTVPNPRIIAQVAFRTSNGHYLCAEGGGGREVVANRIAVGPWETFIMEINFDRGGHHVDLYNGKYALRISGGKYVSADGGGGGAVFANGPKIGLWEVFGMIGQGDGKVALQAPNGKYVSAHGGGGGVVLANSDIIGPWETFTLEIMRSYVDCGPQGPNPATPLYLFVTTGDVSNGGTSATVRMKVSFEDWEIRDITDAKGYWAGQTKTLYSNWEIPTTGLCGKLKSMQMKSVSVYLENDTTFSDQWFLDYIVAGTSNSKNSLIHIGQWIEQGKWYTFPISPNKTKR